MHAIIICNENTGKKFDSLLFMDNNINNFSDVTSTRKIAFTFGSKKNAYNCSYAAICTSDGALLMSQF